jgi:hypothetical protein
MLLYFNRLGKAGAHAPGDERQKALLLRFVRITLRADDLQKIPGSAIARKRWFVSKHPSLF